jgi:hypothetical protein
LRNEPTKLLSAKLTSIAGGVKRHAAVEKHRDDLSMNEGFMELHASPRGHSYCGLDPRVESMQLFSKRSGRRSRDVIHDTGELKSLQQFIYGNTGAIFIGATAAKVSTAPYVEALVRQSAARARN